MKKIINILASILLSVFAFFVFEGEEVNASDYDSICSQAIVSSTGTYKKCGSNNIFIIEETDCSNA